MTIWLVRVREQWGTEAPHSYWQAVGAYSRSAAYEKVRATLDNTSGWKLLHIGPGIKLDFNAEDIAYIPVRYFK